MLSICCNKKPFILKKKLFINNITEKEQVSHKKKMIGKKLRIIIEQLLLMVYMLKAKKYTLPMFPNLIQTVKNKLFFSRLKTEKDGIILQQKKLTALFRGLSSKNNGDFYFLNCLHSFRTKDMLESPKKVQYCDAF